MPRLHHAVYTMKERQISINLQQITSAAAQANIGTVFTKVSIVGIHEKLRAMFASVQKWLALQSIIGKALCCGSNNSLRPDASTIPNAKENRVPSTEHVPVENRLIAALPRKDRQHLLSGCEQVELAFGNILCEPGDAIRHVYFPADCFIALMNPINGHSSLEVALIGSEGMYGIPLMLGVNVSPLHAVVQGSGTAWRMDDERFHSELERSVALQQELNRYLYVLLSQLAQTAACTRFHVVEERLARWLLMIRDRAHSEEFHITHELLAQVLGVRRVGVTKAAGSLQKKKLISYTRGDVKIHDIEGLEAASCRCYRADMETYDRILHPGASPA